ncbi:putative membrane protein [Babesia divergens]|uniref:Membrane protein n=1 Tax=Babesia divergens TaxID=32595 RepID=A0AAD9LGW0_BABDI|nr:putative membrane protein [Babesia divergens]
MKGLRIPTAVVATLSCLATLAVQPSYATSGHTVKKSSGQHMFYVENDGPYQIQCREDQDMIVVDAFAVCLNAFRNNDLRAKRSDKKELFLDAFTSYCPTVFAKKEPCVLLINDKEAVPARFRTKEDLTCAEDEGSAFIGLYHCQDKTKTVVKEGETVSLYEVKTGVLQPRCPSGKKISVINAGQHGNLMCNKGHVVSTMTRASDLCSKKEACDITFDATLSSDCGNFNETHFVKYTCV